MNIDSKFPEILQDFPYEESFIEIAKNILKYTNLFNNLVLRLIFMTMFLLSPVFVKKYENLWWKTMTTRSQKKRQQEKAENLNQDKNQEKLNENFSSKAFFQKTTRYAKK